MLTQSCLCRERFLKLDGRMRVLLAEDEPEMAAVLVAALRNNNIITDHVSTIEAAEEAVRLNSYDALLLDRILPDGDGLELIADARRIQPAVLVIMLTSPRDLKGRNNCRDFGSDG